MTIHFQCYSSLWSTRVFDSLDYNYISNLSQVPKFAISVQFNRESTEIHNLGFCVWPANSNKLLSGKFFSNLMWAKIFFFFHAVRGHGHDVCPPCNASSLSEGHLQRHFSQSNFLNCPHLKALRHFGRYINNHIVTQPVHPRLLPVPYFWRGISWVCHLFIWEPYILWRNGAGLWTQSRRRRMSVRRALPVNHALKGYHPNLQGPLPTHQSSPTRPGHRPISHAHTLVTGDIRRPRRLLSPSPISIPISILSAKSIGITYSKVWLWLCAFQNSVTLPRLCTRLKATVARSVTPAALSRWISALLFIAVMIAGSSYRALLGLSRR